MGDWELLQQFVKDGSEAAFAELVRRHIDWVYSVALRRVSNPELAEEVVQSVFALLARKASRLRPGTVLGGWLFRSTCFVARCSLRAERRRQIREEAASAMIIPQPADENTWQQLAPFLDQAVASLSEADRSAVLLRFYQNLTLAEVGERLGVSEEAAKKRVSRAVEKLGRSINKNGVTLTGSVLATLLVDKVVHAAPAGLAAAVSKSAAAAVLGALPPLAAMAVRLSRWARIKLVAGAVGAAAVLGVVMHYSPAAKWVRSIGSVIAAGVTPAIQPSNDMNMAAFGAGKSGSNAATVTLKPGFLFRVITSDTGRPIPNARVLINRVTDAGWHRDEDLTTDQDGNCTVPLGESHLGRLDVGALKDGFVQKFYTWRADLGEPLPPFYVLKLEPAVRIGGHVQNTPGQPVSDAEIKLMFYGTSDASFREPERERLGFIGDVSVARTDAQGNWHCALTPAGATDFRLEVRHLNYAEADFAVGDGRNTLPLSDLLAGKAAMVLKPGQQISGVVLDEGGKPLPGARVSWMGEANYRQDGVLSDADGSFRIVSLPAGPATISAWAKGFAPSLARIEVAAGSAPLTFHLQRGLTVPLWVVDEDGDGIAGASAALDLPRPHNADFWVTTGPDGRAAFVGVPADAAGGLVCHVGAKGYFYSRNLRINPEEPEPKVRLTKALRVSGDVLDADTREPVMDFKAIPCTGDSIAGYDRSETRRGQLGAYSVEFSEFKPPFRVRIEAEGYEPAMSTPTGPQPAEQRQDILLHKKDATRAIRGVVLGADGQPASGVTVALLTFERGATLFRGTFKRGDEAILATTDDKGAFKFDPDPQAHTLVAADPLGGFARLRLHRSTPPYQLQFQPWGRIEGKVILSGVATPGRAVFASSGLSAYRSIREGLYAGFEPATTDDDGRFAFELVPPGDFTLALMEGTGGTGSLSHSTPAEVRAGETMNVQIGGNGRLVTGKLVMDNGAALDWKAQLIIGSLSSNRKLPAVQPPVDTGDLAGRLTLLDFFDESEEWHQYERASGSLPLEVAPDGAFRVEDVPPGPYLLNVTLSDSAYAGGDFMARMRRRTIASIKTEVIVLDDLDNSQPFDLGIFRAISTPAKPGQ